MTMNALTSIGMGHSSGREVCPVSAYSSIATLISGLKNTAASAAQLCDPLAAALSQMNVVDIRGVTSFQAFGRTTQGSSVSFSTAPKVALYLVHTRGEVVLNSSGNPTGFSKTVDLIQRIDQSGSATAGGLTVNFPTSPISTGGSPNCLASGSYLFTPPVQWTDLNGAIRDVFDCRAAQFLIGLLTTAGVGTAITGELAELVVASAN